jgi:hypothetical protein
VAHFVNAEEEAEGKICASSKFTVDTKSHKVNAVKWIIYLCYKTVALNNK